MDKKIHFIGIGGIGISALARYFSSQGWVVSGSDLVSSSITSELANEGISIFIGHDAKRISRNISRLVYNQAIPESNPELIAARKLGVLCRSYPEMIGDLTREYKTIAVAGAHGKSTTTALISLILIEANFDPTVIIGTKLKEFNNRNFRLGQGRFFIVEADEWKGSFWNYSPTIAVITNIDKEHLDFYKTFANVKKSFVRFVNNIKKDGMLVINSHYLPLLSGIAATSKKIIGFSEKEVVLVKKLAKIMQIPGQHNILNALAAYHVATELGIPEKTILIALSQYRGAWRRMEYRGDLKTVGKNRKQVKTQVFDDYAHHPTEIKATLAGFRQKWPKNRIICVFQAHQVERLKLLFSDFKKAFKDAHEVVVLPTYEVAGRERNEDAELEAENSEMSQKLAKAIKAVYIENPKKELRKTVEALIAYRLSPATIVMMGAGDIINYTKYLIAP